MRTRICICCIFVLAAVVLSGCGGDSPQQTSAVPEPDPRFASLQAINAHYNSIATREPVDIKAMFDMLYAESDLQKRVVKLYSQMMPISIDLDSAMFEQFNEGWAPRSKRRLTAAEPPAVIVKTESARGEAEYVDHKGKKQTVRYVKVGERWWISGYTLEYNPDVSDLIKELDAMERLIPHMGAAAPLIAQQVRSKQFKNPNEARTALMREVLTKNPQLVEDVVALFQ